MKVPAYPNLFLVKTLPVSFQKSVEAGIEKTESWNAVFLQSNVQKLSNEVSALTKSAGLAAYYQVAIARIIHELSETVDQFIGAWDYKVR